MTLKNKKISFVGGGNMAQALISGLLAKGIKPTQITVSDPSKDIRNHLASKKIRTVDPTATDNNQPAKLAVQDADVVVLAVKPQVMGQVVSAFTDILQEQLVISVAAGLSIDTLSKMLGGHQQIVRAMPNTPATIQMGATGLFAHKSVTESQKSISEELMRTAGLALWVDSEDDLHAITATSGSAPAYFFYVFEAMIDAGVSLGLNHKDASALVMQTALGAAQLAITSEDTPAELRRKVTSPNGTTQAAIESLQKDQLAQMFERAMQACVARSKELSQEIS